MTFQIFVICSANICRSPVAGALLDKTFEDAGIAERFSVWTYGASAPAEAPLCPEIWSRVKQLEYSTRLGDHRSHQLHPDSLDRADLVLTADRSVRAAVVRMRPSFHARTFTLRQAAALAESAAVYGRPPADADAEARLRWLVTEMHSWRGLTDVPPVEQRRLARRPWRRVPVHGLDIPDAHQQRRMHPVTARLTVASANRLGAMLVAVAR